jgi:inorganic pyrophosphatase
MRYPGNYGFVPHTLSQIGDPIDLLVANTRPILPGAIINVRPIGVLKMEDDGGPDEKIIGVPTLRSLQGPRTRKVGEAARLGWRGRSKTAYH